ncbi:MAG: hypothetical protein FJZ90_14435, partial [Chloroflexi bacterium]|nr:hypothetical protein [Chloroflexota bacterium]
MLPILYSERDDHTLLHQTLRNWADYHPLGLRGRESIVAQHAGTLPNRPYQDDPLLSQVVWAIRETSGRVAGVFAQHEPLPPAEWLDVFEEHELLRLPSPDVERLPVPLGGPGVVAASPPPLNPVTRALGYWLTRHLDSPRVQHWAIDTGGLLHPDMRLMILGQLERRGCALPPPLQLFWRLVSSGLCEAPVRHSHDVFALAQRLKNGSWDSLIRDELLSALTPCVRLNRPWPRFADLSGDDAGAAEADRLDRYARAEVVLRAGTQGVWLLQRLRESPRRIEVLFELLDDLTTLLKRAMELHAILGHATRECDRSHWDQPSIAPHSQNTGFRGWVVLIELTRDSWHATASMDPARARTHIERWKSLGFPVFRRLIFHAMAHSSLVSPEESLDYLLEDGGWWLWSDCTQRETFRLLHSLWPRLGESDATRLVDAILAGPPRSMFRPDVSDEDYARCRDRDTWLRLEKLREFGGDLPHRAAEARGALKARYPKWELQKEDLDEFVSPILSSSHEELPAPRECLEWREDVWLEKLATTTERELLMRSWRLILREQFDRAVSVLVQAAEGGVWPVDAWEPLLEAAAANARWQARWHDLSTSFAQAPDDVVDRLTRQAARWLLHVSESLPKEGEPTFWPLWERVAAPAFAVSEPEGTDAVTAALNAPAGHLTEALLNRISLTRPRKRDDLPPDMWARLDHLAADSGGSYPTARVLLVSRLALLHDLDAAWVQSTLIWRFDWDSSNEAAALWMGFLWQPQLNLELWNLLKPSFLKTVEHAQELGRHAGQLYGLAAAICIRYPGWISEDESEAILRSIGVKGRKTVAVEIWRGVEGARERGELLWRERVGPWLTKAWPKDRAL